MFLKPQHTIRRERKGLRSHGLVVRAVACRVEGPGFSPSVFFLLGKKVVGKTGSLPI